ncbi:MAG: hypothetical protein OHK0022_52600 [Roseiflexaceae bacterium]
MLLTGFSLAFATIPEEMPIIITMDVAAAAAFVAEPAEPGSMRQPPRDPRAPFLDRTLISGILVAGLGLGVAVSFAHLSTLWGGPRWRRRRQPHFSPGCSGTCSWR